MKQQITPEFIQDSMKAQKTSVKKIARKLSIPDSYIEMVISGNFKSLQLRYIVSIAKAMKIKASSLMQNCILPSRQY